MNLKTKIGIALIAVILIGFSFIQPFSDHALEFLVTTSEELLISLGLITDLKLVVHASDSLPILNKISSGSLTTLDKALNYITLANALVIAQIILLNLSKSVLFKIIGLLCIIGLFIKKTNSIAYKTLIITLLICPGLPIYISILQYVSNEAQLNFGTSLKQELQQTKAKYHSKKEAIKKQINLKHAQQLHDAELKGKKHIGLLKKLEDDVENTAQKTTVDIKQGLSEGVHIIHVLGTKIDALLINLIVTILIVFLVLPLLYFYIIKLALLRLFAFELNRKNLLTMTAYLGELSQDNIAKETVNSINQSIKKK